MTDRDNFEMFDESTTKVEKKKCCRYQDQALQFSKSGASAMSNTWGEFKTFISKGNVWQLAVAFILGLQFNAVVQSLTNDIVMPPIGLAIGNNLVNLFLVIKPGKSFYNQSNIVNGQAQPANPPPPPYTTLVDAHNDGAVTWNWGNFFQVIINFLIVAIILFLLVTLWSKMQVLKKRIMKEKEPEAPIPDIQCDMCYSKLDYRSKICKFCHSHVKKE